VDIGDYRLYEDRKDDGSSDVKRDQLADTYR